MLGRGQENRSSYLLPLEMLHYEFSLFLEAFKLRLTCKSLNVMIDVYVLIEFSVCAHNEHLTPDTVPVYVVPTSKVTKVYSLSVFQP